MLVKIGPTCGNNLIKFTKSRVTPVPIVRLRDNRRFRRYVGIRTRRTSSCVAEPPFAQLLLEVLDALFVFFYLRFTLGFCFVIAKQLS